MQKIQYFNVAPCVPAEIRFLEELAGNLWWSWNSDAIELFRRIDPPTWRECRHNPLLFLGRIRQPRLTKLAGDAAFLAHLREVREHYEETVAPHMNGRTPDADARPIAYFSLEYGIHESVRLYAGGLGALAGDHLKAASDLNLPLVGVGLLYREGYFQQILDHDGWQQERYPEIRLEHLPLRPVRTGDGLPIQVTLPLPEGLLRAGIWRLDVGRVPLYLLDTNLPENGIELRGITGKLYGGDRLTRLRQELLLGIGGVRALRAVGYDPVVYHVNEGHAAFLSLARIAAMREERGLDLDAALEIIRRTNVFTTHTPVPAGNEAFSTDLLRIHLQVLRDELGVSPEQVLAWGRSRTGADELNMSVFGLFMSDHRNAVSALHGETARRMWSVLWPARPTDEVPIRHVTNGIHVPSWISPDHAGVYERYLGPGWREDPASESVRAHIDQISDEELWRAHELSRARLIRVARASLEAQCQHRNATAEETRQARSVLDLDTLTVGFARRFAVYKRATLVLRDRDRLEALLTNEDRPVQILIAGKAHPADDQGKELIRQIVHFSRGSRVRRNLVFLENYDLRLARYLVQGVDVWLNTPRRPDEACGTSGMKAAINGALNVSTLDGWWDEGYAPDVGWAIGQGEVYDDHEYQDAVESQALYRLLEDEIVPRFYERSSGDVPVAWIRMMKAAIRTGLSRFSSHRMVADYERLFYSPARDSFARLTADDSRAAKALVHERRRLESLWSGTSADLPVADRDVSLIHAGDEFRVTVTVRLGELRPDEVDIQLYHGPVDAENRIRGGKGEAMEIVEDRGDGSFLCRQSIRCGTTGRFGYTVRLQPRNAAFGADMPGFLTWAGAD